MKRLDRRLRVPFRTFVVAAALLAAGFSLHVGSRGWAQGGLPAGPLPDGAVYVGETPAGRTMSLFVERGADGSADARLLSAPPALGEPVRFDLAVAGLLVEVEGGWRLRGEVRRRTAASPYADVEVVLPRMEDGYLDPFGVAEVTLTGADVADLAPLLRLEGAGTLLTSETVLADGSLRVARHAPAFYREPWRELDLVAFARLDVDRSVTDGLRARRAAPAVPAGAWWDERTVRVQALAPTLASVRVEHHVYSGGAHPNTHLDALNLMPASDGSWRLASPCEVLAGLRRACDLATVRSAVIDELSRQGAAWVTDGGVTAHTPWLLDLLTFTPTGLRIDFAPYAVGPYAQGLFTVHVPYAALPGDGATDPTP